MDEETKLYVDMLKGLSLAAFITALFRDAPNGEDATLLFLGALFFVIAVWLVRNEK